MARSVRARTIATLARVAQDEPALRNSGFSAAANSVAGVRDERGTRLLRHVTGNRSTLSRSSVAASDPRAWDLADQTRRPLNGPKRRRRASGGEAPAAKRSQ